VRKVHAVAVAAAIVVFVAGCGRLGPPRKPVARIKASSVQVTFSVDGTTTYGTLQIPAHDDGQKLAAALLLAGSGPTDRDGNQPPDVTPGTLRQIADSLASMGIMSLRFDKYFSGATGFGNYATDPGSIDLQAFIRQAAAGYRFMAGEPGVDQHSLLIVATARAACTRCCSPPR
jgi:predicted small lipoprotein YifL